MKKAEKNNGKSGLRNLKNGFFWSAKGLSGQITLTLFTSYLAFYATDVVGLSAGIIATVLLITKLFDGVTDIIAGFCVDNTHTRWGKARPYDWCIPFISLFTILTFSVPKMAPMFQAIWIGVMYVMTQAVFNTLLGASDNVYLMRAFPEERERNNVYAISTIVGQVLALGLGIMLPKWLDSAGVDQGAWTKVIITALFPVTVFGMLRFFMIKEKVVDENVNGENGRKNSQHVSIKDGLQAVVSNRYVLIFTLATFIIIICSGLLNTSAAYYFTYFVGDLSKMSVIALASTSSIVMLIAFVPLSNKFGKDRVVKFGLIAATLGSAIRWIGGPNLVTIGIGMGMTMFGIMPISIYFPLLMIDCIDYGEWHTGKRVEGVLTVMPHFANKVAQGISVSLGMYILGWAGYDKSASVQSDSVMRAIDVSYNVIPTILLGVMTLLIIFFYDLGSRMPMIHKELEERKSQKSE